MQRWIILTATLPTSPSGLRVKVWRALKATGAGTLREGVYVLPEQAPTAAALWELERTIVEAGAEAHLLVVSARDETQERSFRALFDRTDHYAELMQAIKALRSNIRTATEARLRKGLRVLEQQLQAIRAGDFFPGQALQRASAALTALHRDVERHLSPDEPDSRDQAIAPLSIGDYQGRTWATRRRPWIDRLASAWLVQRFVDQRPRFIWISDTKRLPKSALGYDFDGAIFSHVADKVTFEVIAESFGLLDNPTIRRMAQLVHYCDIGGVTVDEAAGLEMVMRGLQARHPDDDALLAAAVSTFDAVYTAMQGQHDH